jgi:GTPase SAR1 family protein
LYCNEFPISVELWDTAGEEKFNEQFTYSKSYVQGKNGIILLVDGSKFIERDYHKIQLGGGQFILSEPIIKNITELAANIKQINNSIKCPLLLVLNRVPVTAEVTMQLTPMLDHLKALIPPNSLQGVKYLPD